MSATVHARMVSQSWLQKQCEQAEADDWSDDEESFAQWRREEAERLRREALRQQHVTTMSSRPGRAAEPKGRGAPRLTRSGVSAEHAPAAVGDAALARGGGIGGGGLLPRLRRASDSAFSRVRSFRRRPSASWNDAMGKAIPEYPPLDAPPPPPRRRRAQSAASTAATALAAPPTKDSAGSAGAAALAVAVAAINSSVTFPHSAHGFSKPLPPPGLPPPPPPRRKRQETAHWI